MADAQEDLYKVEYERDHHKWCLEIYILGCSRCLPLKQAPLFRKSHVPVIPGHSRPVKTVVDSMVPYNLKAPKGTLNSRAIQFQTHLVKPMHRKRHLATTV